MRILVARDASGPFALYGFPDFPQLLDSPSVFEIFIAEGDSLELAQSRARIKCARYDIDPLKVKGLTEKSPRHR